MAFKIKQHQRWTSLLQHTSPSTLMKRRLSFYVGNSRGVLVAKYLLHRLISLGTAPKMIRDAKHVRHLLVCHQMGSVRRPVGDRSILSWILRSLSPVSIGHTHVTSGYDRIECGMVPALPLREKLVLSSTGAESHETCIGHRHGLAAGKIFIVLHGYM